MTERPINYKDRPAPLTPFERIRWQQDNCREDVVGYAVALASDRTERAAYMTGEDCEITNNENKAAVLPKDEASQLMSRLYSSNWYDKRLYNIALLVPITRDCPLNMCTFSGY